MARLSDRVVTGAPNGILSNDEPIQWYAADGITLIDGIKVDPAGAVYLAPAGGPTEVGGTLDVSGDISAPNLFNQNTMINGGFDVWQRGTSLTVTANTIAYTADRWIVFATGANPVVSKAVSGLPTGVAAALNVTGIAGLASVDVSQRIEAVNSTQFKDKTITVSFQLYSTIPTTNGISVLYPNATDNWTGQTSGPSDNYTHGGTGFESFTITFDLTGGFPERGMAINLQLGGFGAGFNQALADYKLEEGSTATTFTRAGNNIAGELAMCERYYTFDGTDQLLHPYDAANMGVTVTFHQSMRVAPTLVVSTVNYTSSPSSIKEDGFVDSVAATLPSSGNPKYINSYKADAEL